MRLHDTILAVASPPGVSARGIVRLSGPQTRELLVSHLAEPPRPGVQAACLRLGDGHLPALLLHGVAPHSYTGEDTAELQMPGNPVLLERVVDALLEAAQQQHLRARRAEPGEFTARAFFNGRLSLTQAEGVAATIAAQSDAELAAAGMLRGGALGRFATDAADCVAAALALVEAGIDFTDQDDVVAITPRDLHARTSALRGAVRERLDRAVGAEQLRAIPWVVLVGRPNAGKSTLFNALLGRTRAVVSDIAGTTRDVLAEPLHVPSADLPDGEGEVMLVDLAGLDPAASALNARMQSAAHEALQRAELRVHCVPADEPPPGDSDPQPQSQRPPTLIVRTKCDLLDAATTPRSRASGICVSAATGAGLDDLRRTVAERLADRAVSLAGDAFVLGPRHEAALREAAARLDEALALIQPQSNQPALSDPELIAAALRAALDALAALAGDITPDDVLGRIFATFCVGK